MEEETRTCQRCGIERPLGMFYLSTEARMSAKRGSKIRLRCRICTRELLVARRKPRQDYIDAIKAERGCGDCGLKLPDHPEVFDFDHLDQSKKSATVSSFLTKGTWEDLDAEIAKCELICANCHRIRTRSRVHAGFGKDRK